MDKKKEGWFSRMFFESAEGNKEEVVEKTAENISVTNSGGALGQSPFVGTSMNIPVTGDGVFDQKFNDSFQELIAENNIPGIDYFEFRQALVNMAGVAGLNESASIQTAFMTLKVGDPSLTKEKLTSSIEHYDSLLLKEEKEFNEAMNAETQKEVTSRRERAQALNSENIDIVQQIQNLNEKIAKNQTDAITLNSEASQAEANINQTGKNFIATLAHVRAKLETDKQKINQLIQGEIKTT